MACHRGFRLALVSSALACGGGSSSTSDATTSASTSVAETTAADATSADDSTAASGSSSTAASTVADSDGGTTGGIACTSNADCGNDELCDFADESCGVSGKAGTCMPRPSDCANDPRPVCGCDDVVYNSVCHAAAAGADLAFLGHCEVPNGAFTCGYSYCILDQEYCAIEGGAMPSAMCIVLPPVCQPPDCNCISDCCDCDSSECCADVCTNEGGALTYVCPG